MQRRRISIRMSAWGGLVVLLAGVGWIALRAPALDDAGADNRGALATAETPAGALSETHPRAQLLQRFLNDSGEREQLAIIARLIQDSEPQALAFGRDLLASSDASARRHGHELLLGVVDMPGAQQVMAEALANESDSAVLRGATIALAKTDEMPEQTSTELRQQLRRLALHADAGVQSAALQAMARWDSSTEADAVLRRALRDPRAELREAVMTAVEGDVQRLQTLKPELTAVAHNTGERPDLRRVALEALRGTTLSLDEAIELRRIGRELSAAKAPAGLR